MAAERARKQWQRQTFWSSALWHTHTVTHTHCDTHSHTHHLFPGNSLTDFELEHIWERSCGKCRLCRAGTYDPPTLPDAPMEYQVTSFHCIHLVYTKSFPFPRFQRLHRMFPPWKLCRTRLYPTCRVKINTLNSTLETVACCQYMQNNVTATAHILPGVLGGQHNWTPITTNMAEEVGACKIASYR